MEINSQPERRRSERVLLTIPILVMGTNAVTGEFSEVTHTLVVNHEGALIALKQRVAAEDTLRIINLEDLNEADFRVVGPTRFEGTEVADWGVEYLKEGRNIWGIEFSSAQPSEGSEPCALLECRACLKRSFSPVTLMEIEVLNSTGIIQDFCDHCGRRTHWAYADPRLRPREIPSSEPVAPPPMPSRQSERRSHKRNVVRLPILVRNQKGEEEITKTENISRGDLAVSLAIDLTVEGMVTVVCPYNPEGRNIEKKAEVRRRDSSFFSRRRLYGLRYVL